MPIPENQREMDAATQAFLKTLDRWISEGRLSVSELGDLNSPELQAKIERLTYEDMGRNIKQMSREAKVEQFGYKYGCVIIIGILFVVALLILKGC